MSLPTCPSIICDITNLTVSPIRRVARKSGVTGVLRTPPDFLKSSLECAIVEQMGMLIANGVPVAMWMNADEKNILVEYYVS